MSRSGISESVIIIMSSVSVSERVARIKALLIAMASVVNIEVYEGKGIVTDYSSPHAIPNPAPFSSLAPSVKNSRPP